MRTRQPDHDSLLPLFLAIVLGVLGMVASDYAADLPVGEAAAAIECERTEMTC